MVPVSEARLSLMWKWILEAYSQWTFKFFLVLWPRHWPHWFGWILAWGHETCDTELKDWKMMNLFLPNPTKKRIKKQYKDGSRQPNKFKNKISQDLVAQCWWTTGWLCNFMCILSHSVHFSEFGRCYPSPFCFLIFFKEFIICQRDRERAQAGGSGRQTEREK